VDYQPISNYAQLQLLEGLLRMFLHGVLLTMAAASVLLLCLCLSELRLPRRRSSEFGGLGGRVSGDPIREIGRREPGSFAGGTDAEPAAMSAAKGVSRCTARV
jgi:hypothetical protein